jgi:hypothetical protein
MTDAGQRLTMNDLVEEYNRQEALRTSGTGLTSVEAQPGGFYGNTPTTHFSPYSGNTFRLTVDEAGNVVPGKFGFKGDVIAGPAREVVAPTGSSYSLSDVSRTGMNQGLRISGEPLGQGLRSVGGESLYQVGRGATPVPGMGQGIMSAAKNIYGGEYMKAASDLGDVFFGSTPRTIGTGLALTSVLSKPKQPGPPGIIPKETGYDLLRRSPEIYGVTPGGGYIVYGNPYNYPQRMAQGGIAAVAPRRYALGGYAAGGNTRFPRRTGPINGPGTETSDSIPAMLSDGEFVMTARAVRGAGKGSRREGAKKMYAMMKALERKSNG